MSTSVVIIDHTITEVLRKVFGHENVAPPEGGTGYFAVFFSTREQANAVMNLFPGAFDDYMMHEVGNFTSASRPNMWLLIGNESARRQDGKLNDAAALVINFVEANAEPLRLAAGITEREIGA